MRAEESPRPISSVKPPVPAGTDGQARAVLKVVYGILSMAEELDEVARDADDPETRAGADTLRRLVPVCEAILDAEAFETFLHVGPAALDPRLQAAVHGPICEAPRVRRPS